MSLECPYCEYEFEDPDELPDRSYNIEATCPRCGKKFLFDVDYEPVYFERKADCLNGSPHVFEPYPGTNIGTLRCKVCLIIKGY